MRPGFADAYSYLLGLYLGDGYIWESGRLSWRLGVTLDRNYPEVEEAVRAIMRLLPHTAVCVNAKPHANADVVLASSQVWRLAFPQHGPGKKHERPIELANWQRDIIHRFPRDFLRGLIHSDGSRCINSFEVDLPRGGRRRYSYPRYFFTNYSADI